MQRFVWALGIVLGVHFGVPGLATAALCSGACTLVDDNSTVKVDVDSQAGMFEWSVDGVSNLFQQWFWYRVGATGAEISLDTLTRDISLTIDTNGDGGDNNLYARYLGSGFKIEINYSLDGGVVGGRSSQIGETIKITNTSTQTLDFHFFQYSDFNLDDDAENDVVRMMAPNSVKQTGEFGVLSETVVTPFPSAFELGFFSDTRDSLNDGSPTNLTSGTTYMGPGNVTWAFQWDVQIAAGEDFLISKVKRVDVVSEPSTLSVLALGLAAFAYRRRRRNRV